MTTENDILGFDPQSLSVFNTEEKQPKSQGNPLIYKTRPADSVSDDGHYYATIKVVYNPFNPKQSTLDQQSYTIQDKDGWLTVVSSLTNNDTSWPIYLTCKGTYNTYNVYTSGSQAYSGTEQDYVSPAWSKPSWVSAISSTTLNGVSAYSITLTQNTGTSDRSDTITDTSGSAAAPVTIKQLCKP